MVKSKLFLIVFFAFILFVGTSILAQNTDEKPKEISLAGRTEMPLTLYGNKPVVEVKINGQGPYSFFLDTGAGGTVLDQSLADELKLQIVGTMKIGDPADPQGVEAKRDHIDQLVIGGA